MVSFSPLFFPFLERLRLLAICWWAESACGVLGGGSGGLGTGTGPGGQWGRGCGGLCEPLGLEAGGLAWGTGAERQVGPAACWLPLVLRLHQLGEGGFASRPRQKGYLEAVARQSRGAPDAHCAFNTLTGR